MSLHLQRDLDALKKEILQLGNLVEQAIDMAIGALVNRDARLAREATSFEETIDRKEVAIEVECLKILALHQPVAVDLRFIVVVLKVNNDLERMGDIACNIAGRAAFIAGRAPVPVLAEMAGELPGAVRAMVHQALDALVRLDVALARAVIAMDDRVDDINRRMYADVTQLISRDPPNAEVALNLLSASRYMERIADLATNIAEEVLFMVEGRVVRHEGGNRV